MFKTGNEDTAKALAKERKQCCGFSVFDGVWYVGAPDELRRIGVMIVGSITLDEARTLLEEIRRAAVARDCEVAHAKEDDLRQRVLLAVAAGSPLAIELAQVALDSSAIQFSRWTS